MSELKKELQMGFTHEHFPESCHICLIYENEQQRHKIVSEYIAAGLKQGELVRYFNDTTTPETIRSWLLELGVESSEAEQNGSFGLSDAEKAYCPDGEFEPQKMIDRAVQRYGIAKKAGFTGSRACGEMSWALKDIPGSDRLLEYEVLLNTITSSFPHNGMCQYDARLFDGATIFKVLQVHPYIIAQGQIVRNPYYIKPEDFLAEKKS
ncbi:MAG: hypothetical protein A2W85_04555 [Bacteroidetes bacterium GWF2_41_31]|nr:MAG: hypothetical protein A2W85_04555 [Bacteroidetes bacterium GWF2_41_31]